MKYLRKVNLQFQFLCGFERVRWQAQTGWSELAGPAEGLFVSVQQRSGPMAGTTPGLPWVLRGLFWLTGIRGAQGPLGHHFAHLYALLDLWCKELEVPREGWQVATQCHSMPTLGPCCRRSLVTASSRVSAERPVLRSSYSWPSLVRGGRGQAGGEVRRHRRHVDTGPLQPQYHCWSGSPAET